MEGSDANIDPTIRKCLNIDFWNQLHLKESLIKQKSRMKWVQEGDSNSRYFHESIKTLQEITTRKSNFTGEINL
jgi:hypothetical protein